MEELDGDEVRVSSRGRFAERDIVQVKTNITFFFLHSGYTNLVSHYDHWQAKWIKYPDYCRQINIVYINIV